jgi:hypothetical protein
MSDLIKQASEALSKKPSSTFFNITPHDVPDEMDIALSNSYGSLFEGVSNMIEDNSLKPFLKAGELTPSQTIKLFKFLNKNFKTHDKIRELVTALVKAGA